MTGEFCARNIVTSSLALMEPPLQSHRDENDPVLSKAPKPDVFVVKLSR